MALTPEQKSLLVKIKRNRPDLIQQLKAEFYEEWKATTDIMIAIVSVVALGVIFSGEKWFLSRNRISPKN